MLTDGEIIVELHQIRFKLMRINGVLASEQRPNHTLLVLQELVDDQIRQMAPEAE